MERQNLRRLLLAMSHPYTFYVLGAGASAGLVPFTAGIRNSVRGAYFNIRMYPVTSAAGSPLFERVVKNKTRSHYDFPDLLLEAIPSSTLELLVEKELSPSLDREVPPQYAILQRVSAPAVFFNFNLDGLAGFYLHRPHLVLEPHGAVDRQWTEAPNFDEWLECSLDIDLPSIRPKVLPGPEPSLITSSDAYLSASPTCGTRPRS